jgi:hypothetical protein
MIFPAISDVTDDELIDLSVRRSARSVARTLANTFSEPLGFASGLYIFRSRADDYVAAFPIAALLILDYVRVL